MKSKVATVATIMFFVIYLLACTVGSIFLVTWGSPSAFKSFMNFMLTFPIDWNALIMNSFFYLLLNILFWSTIVYVLTLFAERQIRFLLKLHQQRE